jgi:hypothetical protein
MRCQRLFIIWVLLLSGSAALAQSSGNLLRNGEFQDDWITLLPETKNHHWCFPSEFFNRRDYNPDGWYCKGNWDWQNADAPWGQRRLVLHGPAELYQRVNWVTIHDDRQLEGFPDAGGFPAMKPAYSPRPERLVRDLTFRVRLSGKDVPKDAGQLEVGLCPASGTSSGDPMGTRVAPTASAFSAIPDGTYASQWVTVKLLAADWLQAARKAANNLKEDLALPASVAVAIRYVGKTGRLDVEQAELSSAAADAPNLLVNGGFETVDAQGDPVGWSQAIKYRYFPPRHYYIFNTWHNANFPNRGFTAVDSLLPHEGKHSLRMIVPSGDETAVVSEPIVLKQKESRLIEVTAWIKTDRLCNLQIDGLSEKGDRLDGFNFIHKAPVSIGTDNWRMIRQVFRPRTPVQSLRLVLAARGVNGYTLDDTGVQPQSNVAGTIWWDDVRVSEPESDAAELQARGVKPVAETPAARGVRIVELDLGERLLGQNVLTATIDNPGAARRFALRWEYTPPNGKKSSFETKPQEVTAKGRTRFAVPYLLSELCENAYTEYHGRLTLLDEQSAPIQASELWFGTWTTPIKLDLGALYLRPDQKQFVRMNLGLAQATLAKLKTIRLEIVRRGNGAVLKTQEVDATPKALLEQRAKIPAELRDDFANLVLTDLDVATLPLQPFANPERNWIVRATAFGNDGKTIARVASQPFCRQAHEPPQPAIQNVTIKNQMTYINGQPWMPFGVAYGHTPVYDGPADPGPGKYRDLGNLPGWSMYDRHNSASSNRKQYDFNCMRYVAGSITSFDVLEKRWKGDNLYCSSAFAVPTHTFSLDGLFKLAGGQDKLNAYLEKCRTAPMVVSIAPGIEEAFGLFQGATPQELQGLAQVVEYVRQKSGRPVMVGHGGYWNRLEFEKAPFFDIFDPETEPLFPANLHTDLAPLVQGKNKAVWLRPQMYESIPYERWRFHAYVELMRGCRGWQIAHGPGDASLFRGLHGELEFMKPIAASTDLGPKVRIEPRLESWSRRHQGKTYVIAASTRGIPLGQWQWSGDAPAGSQRSRRTEGRTELRDESNAYGIGQTPEAGAAIHGVQYLPDAKSWPKGTKLVQWVKLDANAMPAGLLILAKADGRWTHAATFGKVDLKTLRADPKVAYWFLNSFYRHAKGFLGWGTDLVAKSLEYVPDKAFDSGPLPKAGAWMKLEIPLDQLGAAGKLLDGVGFLHDGGQVLWGPTALVAPDGQETVLWGEAIELPAQQLANVKAHVEGLQAGTRIRVLFEDREIIAQAGYFEDDFRGHDLYQRYGGSTGYGSAPVALHLYEIPSP